MANSVLLMAKKILSIITALCILFASFGLPYIRIYAQVTPTATPTPTTSISNADWPQPCQDKGYTGQDCVDYLSSTVSNLKGQEQTLSSQIDVMDSQIALTQARIQNTQQQIMDLTLNISTANTKINSLQGSINNLTRVLLNRIVATYEVGSSQPFQVLMTSSDIHDFFVRANYLKIAQAHDKQLAYDTVQAKNDYANQKQIYETKKKQVEALNAQLQAYTQQLDQEKTQKKQLLADTKGSEANYQQLLEKAREQLAGFSSFALAAGGGLTSFGIGSNGWYYTQRDPQWGNMLLPGSSSSVFLAGCAVTSVAMVCKSYGQNVTPATLVSNSSYFIGGDLWNWAFSCSGKTTDWFSPSQDMVRSYVNNGTPVILRLISPSVSGLHFVVAWKWDGSDFIIHDPYYGPDKRFSDRYSWSQVTNAIAIH